MKNNKQKTECVPCQGYCTLFFKFQQETIKLTTPFVLLFR